MKDNITNLTEKMKGTSLTIFKIIEDHLKISEIINIFLKNQKEKIHIEKIIN